MAKLSWTCCGKVIEVEMIGEGYIRCPKCKKRLRRLFDKDSDTYIFIPYKQARKAKRK